jgi:hypothetical protein
MVCTLTFRDYFYKTGTNDQWEVFKRELGLNLPGQAGFWRRAALTPGYRYFMQYYTLAMANLDPIQIGIGGSTVGTVGHDVRLEDWTCSTPIEMYGLPIQNFAKAYRALPAKSFDDVQLYGRMEGPDPYELGFARKDEDDGYFYIMNRTSHTIWARLTFKDGKANMTDLTTGATMEYDREDPQVVLQPYELKSFRFNGTEYSLDHVWLGNPTT